MSLRPDVTPGLPEPPPEAVPYLDTYLAAVRDGDQRAAVDISLDMHEHGFPAEAVIGSLLAPAQAEVGRLWQEGRWGVALEHRATAITEVAVSAVAAAERAGADTPPEGSRGRSAVACSEGEWHSLPARMLAEILRLRGVDVSFIGPSMPASELAAFLGPEPPGVVAVSCSLTQSLPGAWRAVTALRALGVEVVAGGRGFGSHGRWSAAVGADVWGATLSIGADLVLAAQGQPLSAPRPSSVPEDRVDEVRYLARSGDAVVEQAVAEAVTAWPTMMARDAALVATREDLRSTLRTVVAATLVDDEQVVVEFVRWFEAVLSARGLPVAFVPSAFELLSHRIPGALPVADRMVRAGLEACTAAPLARG